MSSIADYVGRTIDLLAFAGATASGEVQVTEALVLPGQFGEVTTGIQKLAQRFLIELLTETGSLSYLPIRGCEFMADARLGLWRTNLDVTQSFASALIDIKRNLILEEQTTDPDDERFGAASLLSVTLTRNTVFLRVALTSLAGSSRVFLMPLPVVI